MVFSIVGAVVALLVLLPSLTLLFLKPLHAPERKKSDSPILTVLENAGRVACIVVLLFSKEELDRYHINIWLTLMLICILVYYVLWLRYIFGGRYHYLLYKPLGFIAVPMAVFPALVFFFAGFWSDSLLLVFMAVLFGIGHIANSYSIYKKNYSA